MPSPEIFYSEKLQFHKEQQTKFKRQLAVSGILRLIMFVAFLCVFYFLLTSWGTLFKVASLITILGFISLVRHGLYVKEQLNWSDQMVFINNNELNVLRNLPNAFENGARFSEKDGYDSDLDIFGSNSLYHLLNRTSTSHGAEYLAGLLKHPLLDMAEILLQQDAIRTFAQQRDIRQSITAHGLLNGEENGNLQTIYDWLKFPAVLSENRWIRVIRYLLPGSILLCLLYYLISDNYFPVIIGIFINWIVIGLYARYINKQHLLLSKKQAILDQYAGILQIFSTVNASESTLLKNLAVESIDAGRSVSKLSKLAGLFDQRMNLLVNLFLNSFFLYDIQCMIALEKWKSKHVNRFQKWIDVVGHIECINSFSSFHFNNPLFVFPHPIQGQAALSATALAHPLIHPVERVTNDIHSGHAEKILLITGSNMSGKTTFLRTVGVNILLAQCGSPVCATAFTFTPMNILSSIRVNDSLQEHTSYFMAELQRLQLIIHELKTGIPALVLVDEILKGTNSEDKNYGSESFIKKLLLYNCICLFATHDLSLGNLEVVLGGKLKNYCFESSLQNNDLFFDYRLGVGIAKNKNASFLMKKMGII